MKNIRASVLSPYRPTVSSRRDRAVVITGASSGIGRASASLFSRRGWRIGLIARGQPGLESIRDELVAAGGEAYLAVADVSDPHALELAATTLEQALGPFDVWVNCAGNGVFGRFIDTPDEEFRRVNDVTYMGTVHGTRVALRRMLARDEGVIVNVCSAVAYRGMPLLSSYSGAKHAVRGFSEAVRSELTNDASRVRITTVFPPAVNTPYFSHAASHMPKPPRPAPPVYQPEVVADAVMLAATSRRQEMQVSSITVLFALATRLAPGLIDRAIQRLGYAGQMTDNPNALRLREPTLFAPSAHASGTRGPFGAESRRFSVQMWMSRHRVALAAGVGLLTAGLFLARHWPA